MLTSQCGSMTERTLCNLVIQEIQFFSVVTYFLGDLNESFSFFMVLLPLKKKKKGMNITLQFTHLAQRLK